jgi:hypothetical protein
MLFQLIHMGGLEDLLSVLNGRLSFLSVILSSVLFADHCSMSTGRSRLPTCCPSAFHVIWGDEGMAETLEEFPHSLSSEWELPVHSPLSIWNAASHTISFFISLLCNTSISIVFIE